MKIYLAFKNTRNPQLRFDNGQFCWSIGLLETEARPFIRAYSIASPNTKQHWSFSV